MDTLTFGLSLTVVGMGGTLASLWLLTLVIRLLKKAFPPLPDPLNGAPGRSRQS